MFCKTPTTRCHTLHRSGSAYVNYPELAERGLSPNDGLSPFIANYSASKQLQIQVLIRRRIEVNWRLAKQTKGICVFACKLHNCTLTKNKHIAARWWQFRSVLPQGLGATWGLPASQRGSWWSIPGEPYALPGDDWVWCELLKSQQESRTVKRRV